jgi:hypothetical protein
MFTLLPSCSPQGHDPRMTTRRFPAPWRTEKMPGGYVVRDANGQALAYVYCRANEAEAMQAKVLTEDEARPRRQRREAGCWPLLGRKGPCRSHGSPAGPGLREAENQTIGFRIVFHADLYCPSFLARFHDDRLNDAMKVSFVIEDQIGACEGRAAVSSYSGHEW